jgi:hypothetical protein
MSVRSLVLAAAVLASAAPALAASFDGTYEGASSIATGTAAYCTGNAYTRATVYGDAITIQGPAYEGVAADGHGTVKADGSFTASKPTKDGAAVAYSGKISGKNLIATWKGPACTGTLSLQSR